MEYFIRSEKREVCKVKGNVVAIISIQQIIVCRKQFMCGYMEKNL